MRRKKIGKHLRPRQNAPQKALDSAITAAFFRPPGNREHRDSAGHR